MKINESSNGTKLLRFGKFTGTLYPEIYFQFVSSLHREHPDLIQAMTLGKMQLKDASALDYLCQILEVKIEKDWPMEKGYQVLYDKLKLRLATRIAKEEADRLARDNFNKDVDYTYRDPEHAGKPLFPSIEEQIERGDK